MGALLGRGTTEGSQTLPGLKEIVRKSRGSRVQSPWNQLPTVQSAETALGVGWGGCWRK